MICWILSVQNAEKNISHENLYEAVLKWIYTMWDKNGSVPEPFLIEKENDNEN